MPIFPSYLILEDRVYELAFSEKIEGGRAFDRLLTDYRVTGKNVLNKSDHWNTLIGISRELYDDYPSFKIQVPLEWILNRFLIHHVRTNSIKLLSGPGGEVLTSKIFERYLGRDEIDENEVDRILKVILNSWAHVFPNREINFIDIYISTDIEINLLERGINFLKFNKYIEEISEHKYKLIPSNFEDLGLSRNLVSLDRNFNRYFQVRFRGLGDVHKYHKYRNSIYGGCELRPS